MKNIFDLTDVHTQDIVIVYKAINQWEKEGHKPTKAELKFIKELLRGGIDNLLKGHPEALKHWNLIKQ